MLMDEIEKGKEEIRRCLSGKREEGKGGEGGKVK